jgi:hypothetical protein
MVSVRLCGPRAGPGSESIEAGRVGALNNVHHDVLGPPLRPRFSVRAIPLRAQEVGASEGLVITVTVVRATVTINFTVEK